MFLLPFLLLCRWLHGDPFTHLVMHVRVCLSFASCCLPKWTQVGQSSWPRVLRFGSAVPFLLFFNFCWLASSPHQTVREARLFDASAPQQPGGALSFFFFLICPSLGRHLRNLWSLLSWLQSSLELLRPVLRHNSPPGNAAFGTPEQVIFSLAPFLFFLSRFSLPALSLGWPESLLNG
jgi:hypothetical protein